jgi:preprotein translocase subunit SecG
METLLKFIHIFASLFLILVVLLQSGRSGGMGAALGGASGQIFGGRGAGNFLTRVTSGAAVVFFLTSLTLSMLSSRHRSVLVGQQAPAAAVEADATEGGGDEDPPETEPEGDDGERSGKNSPADGEDDDAEHVDGHKDVR